MKAQSMLLGVLTLAALAAPSAVLAVNCAQVNKYLGTGRSVQDVAETMVISEDEVRKCQQEAAPGTGGGAASPTPAAGGTTKLE